MNMKTTYNQETEDSARKMFGFMSNKHLAERLIAWCDEDLKDRDIEMRWGCILAVCDRLNKRPYAKS